MDGMLEWLGFYNRLTSLYLWFFSVVHYLLMTLYITAPPPTTYPEFSRLQSWYGFINLILVLAAVRLNE